MRDLHMIVLPGGGYRDLAAHEAEPVAEWLSSLGCTAEVVRYPVRTRHPGPLTAVCSAVRRAREGGASRVGVIGFSAGGHAAGLAALAPGATPQERVDLAVLCYPVTSMQLESHAGSRENLIGLDASPELRRSTSLDALASPSAPPFFLWHTADDAAVPVEHSYALASALARHGVPHALHVYPSGAHGLGLARDGGDASVWTRDCAEWLAALDR